MIKPRIEDLIFVILSGAGYSELPKVTLEAPRHDDHGDYATTICFQLAKTLKKSPKEIAEQVTVVLNTSPQFSEVGLATALNGFVNIKLNDAWLFAEFCRPAQGDFPKSNDRFLVEYVSANPTGPLHIGHGRWAVIGSALVSLLKRVGFDVHSEFYINDAGNQVNNFHASVNAVKNGLPIPENGYHGAYIADLAKSDTNPLEAMLASQKQVLASMGVEFDTWFRESSLTVTEDNVKRALDELRSLGFIYELDGATWFKSTDFGDDKDRVVVKADGVYSYFAADIAYHYTKLTRGYTRLINLFGADHHGYVHRIKACVKAFKGTEYVDDVTFKIIVGQLVNLFRDGHPVRMSKRTGDMIMLDDVVDEIGADATRYFLLEKSPDTHLDFDLSLAVKQSSDNPVFYVQYAHARICQILGKVSAASLTSMDSSPLPLNPHPTPSHGGELDPVERQVVLEVLRYEDVLWYSATALMPHKIVHYAYHLAKTFHLFYEHCPILKADQADQERRIVILKILQATLRDCFNIMGISAPDSM
jgi:arginyl-tRNA synthetase